MKDILSFQINYLLRQNNIKVDQDEVSFQIQSHPTYPSLHAVTGVLDHFNIENLALEVPVDETTIAQLPKSFLAQVREDNQDTFAIISKNDQKFNLVYNQKKKETLSLEELLEKFIGIMLAVEKSEEQALSSSRSYLIQKIKKVAICFAGLFAISWLLISGITLWEFSLLLTSVLGIYVSYAIIKQEEGENTVLGDAFCSNPSEKRNCNAVLSSKGAMLFGSLKISNLSAIYFTAMALTSFVLILANASYTPIYFVSFIALPITVYSIYYQAWILKTWCALCLSLVGILWVQAALSVYHLSFSIDFESVALTGLSFAIAIILILVLLSGFKNANELRNLKINSLKFRRNFELFESQLHKSRTLSKVYRSDQSLVFGAPESPMLLTIVTNPLCGHCKPVHKILEKILKQYGNLVRVNVVFNVRSDQASNNGTKIALKLLELHNEKDAKTSLIAMHDIYSILSTDQWFKKWGGLESNNDYLIELQRQEAWCKNNDINFTPEILINGMSYPKIYDRSDLLYFIEDLNDKLSISKNEEVVQV